MKNATNYRNHWTGWLIPCRVAYRKGYNIYGIMRRKSVVD